MFGYYHNIEFDKKRFQMKMLFRILGEDLPEALTPPISMFFYNISRDLYRMTYSQSAHLNQFLISKKPSVIMKVTLRLSNHNV